ncbi:MAG: alpha/beta hydrolase [Acidimicrobiia bacterium]|nr:alpha/beta hydrolase [Acidimicrobiia bacterium]
MLDLPEPHRATFADLGRTSIRTWEWGDPSRPPVLLIHGGWDHGRMWDGLAPRIVDELDRFAVAVDVRGHGDSGRLPEAGPSWPMFMIDMAQICQRLGPPVMLVGHSFGGGLVLAIAAAFPDLVERVVNLDGLGPPPEMMLVQDHAAVAERWLYDADRIHREPPREYPSVEAMAQKRKDINTRLPYEWCMHLATHGTKPGQNGGYTWKADPRFRLGSPEPFDEAPPIAQYRVLNRPVLALSGTEPDQWSFLSPEDRERRLDAFPDVEHHGVANAGHYIHVEQPEETIRLIDAFVHR